MSVSYFRPFTLQQNFFIWKFLSAANTYEVKNYMTIILLGIIIFTMPVYVCDSYMFKLILVLLV
jgi:hypothetical protein